MCNKNRAFPEASQNLMFVPWCLGLNLVKIRKKKRMEICQKWQVKEEARKDKKNSRSNQNFRSYVYHFIGEFSAINRPRHSPANPFFRHVARSPHIHQKLRMTHVEFHQLNFGILEEERRRILYLVKPKMGIRKRKRSRKIPRIRLRMMVLEREKVEENSKNFEKYE